VPTIKDVADHAGVSITTVSHVLNQTRHVNGNLVDRVQAAITVLGYQPNAVARSLRKKETRTLGMVIPDNSNPYFADMARSIEDASFELGYNVILCNSDEDPAKERAYLQLLLEKQVDGIAFVASGRHRKHLRPLLEHKVPLVVLDRDLGYRGWDSVLVENRIGGHHATLHLIEGGHRRIGCIGGPPDLIPSRERAQGYQDALLFRRLAVDPILIRKGSFHAEGGYAAMLELLDLHHPPTAVFVCNDMMAVGALRAIADRGLQAPEDVAVVGFDDIELASYTRPSLTTVTQPVREMGELATRLLVGRLNGDTRTPQQYRLQTRLVIRESCGRNRASHRGDARETKGGETRVEN
jgi:LacI family transcriptional regulator